MNTNQKIMLLLLLSFEYAEVNYSQSEAGMSMPSRMQQRPAAGPSVQQRNIPLTISISQEDMIAAITAREKNANKNYDDIEYHANELVQQNYKTDKMKYDILLLMNSDTINQANISKKHDELPSIAEIQRQTTPFLKVNLATASIENFPTIFQILEKTTGTDPENKNRPVIINGLQATLRAINGAIADIKYDRKYIFASDIETRLRSMQKQIENRIKELNPISWIKLSLGVGSLVAVAAAAGAYYSGITMKDSQEYFADIIKKYQLTANMINSLPSK